MGKQKELYIQMLERGEMGVTDFPALMDEIVYEKWQREANEDEWNEAFRLARINNKNETNELVQETV